MRVAELDKAKKERDDKAAAAVSAASAAAVNVAALSSAAAARSKEDQAAVAAAARPRSPSPPPNKWSVLAACFAICLTSRVVLQVGLSQHSCANHRQENCWGQVL